MTACQRWLHRRDRYRPAGEVLDPSRYGVELLPSDRVAGDFIRTHHYSGSMPAARLRVGLYRMRELVGVAVFSVPPSGAVLPKWLGVPGVELGRLVLLDDVPGNGETWFLARAFRALRSELSDVRAVLSFSDPMERATAGGDVVKPGHIGVIYQAFGGRYLGRSNRATLLIDPAGRVISPRAFSKVRTGSQGRDYAERVLVASGAPSRRPHEDGAAWVRRCLVEAPWRRVRHPGNHAYAWPVASGVALPPEKIRPCTRCGEQHCPPVARAIVEAQFGEPLGVVGRAA